MKFRIIFSTFFVSLIFVSSSFAYVDLANFVNHVHMIQNLKEYFKKNTQGPQKSNSRCQTDAYLSIEKLKNNAEKHFEEEHKRHPEFFKKILNKERELADTHYVFYHAQRGGFKILQDFQKDMYQYLFLKELMGEFSFLRLWYKPMKTVDVNTFIDDYEQGYPTYWDDGYSYLRDRILSVNLNLYGNTGYSGECTLSYFFQNYNIAMISCTELMESLFEKLNINKRYLHDMLQLSQKNYATLYQIFIPKEQVDSCVYLSHSYGTPYRDCVVDWLYDNDKRRHLKISPILEKYRNHPEQISHLNTIQARIVFSQDMMTNPDSGIKIYNYSLIPERAKQEYEKERRRLSCEIIKDTIGSGLFPTRAMEIPLVALANFIYRSPQG